MNEEHDGADRRKPSEEEYQRFRKMIDGVGREGLQRMIEHLTERIETNPRDTEALGGRGLAYAELGEHRLAAEDNGSVIALDPDNADAYFGRAQAYSKLEEHRLAVADYDAGIRLAPGDAVAHYSRGACKAELGDLAGAMSDFDVAVTLAPADADAHYNRGLTHVVMGKRHRAVKDLSRAIDLNPNLADAHYHRGMAYRDMVRVPRTSGFDGHASDARVGSNPSGTVGPREREGWRIGRDVDSPIPSVWLHLRDMARYADCL